MRDVLKLLFFGCFAAGQLANGCFTLRSSVYNRFVNIRGQDLQLDGHVYSGCLFGKGMAVFVFLCIHMCRN